MKKIILLLSVALCLLLTSCTTDTSGYSHELKSNRWIAQLDGGAEAELRFFDDSAVFIINSGGEETRIEGKFIADDSSFVIFMPDIAQNYTFEYTSKGKQLILRYQNCEMVMTQKK